jgi:uncharacterized repeat protein (TIGR03803 family)
MKRTYLVRPFDPLISCCVLKLILLFAVLLVTVRPVQSQTETVLYNFTGGSDGGLPESRLTFHGANLYGTALAGGLGGVGTVFKLSPNGSGGWKETVLYAFCPEGGESCPDGGVPN